MKKQQTEVVKIRIGLTEKTELERIAESEQRTFAGQVRLALREWINQRGTSCAKELGRKKNNMVVCKTSYNSAMLRGLKPHAGGAGTSA